ncbi:MAG: peptidylprolyl isomerase [Kiritimatiellae bacterium]|nr:peptidylprolyl isomerase [Kiritimatiellia bacterium]
MKKILTILFALTLTVVSYGQEILIDGIAAKVNSQSVLISDVLMVMQPQIAELQNKYAGSRLKKEMQNLYEESLDSLIERQVILDTYQKQDMKLPDDVINNRINDIIFDRFQGNKEKLIKTLAQDRLTFEKWKEEVTNQFIVMVMRNSNVNSKINISPAIIKEYYNKHLDEYKQPEKVLINMIILEKTDDKETEAKKKELIFQIQQKLQKGEAFTALAKEFSEDSTAEEGGNIGWIEPQMLRKEVAEAIKKLKIEDISKPIETENEIYLIELKGKKESTVQSFLDVEKDIKTLLTKEEVDKVYSEWISSLLENAYIKKSDLELF